MRSAAARNCANAALCDEHVRLKGGPGPADDQAECAAKLRSRRRSGHPPRHRPTPSKRRSLSSILPMNPIRLADRTLNILPEPICRTDPVFGVTTKDRIPHSIHIEMELLQFGCEPGL